MFRSLGSRGASKRLTSLHHQFPFSRCSLRSMSSHHPLKYWENANPLGDYASCYKESITHSEKFWDLSKDILDWDTPYNRVLDNDMKNGFFEFYPGGKLNASVNCIDRHIKDRGDQVALIWEMDEPGNTKFITYNELLRETSRAANVLKRMGVRKGDCVAIYLPTMPESVYMMMACARIGAAHNVVFGGYSAEALRERIRDAQAKVLVTADEAIRGGKKIPLKETADKAAMHSCPSLTNILVVERTGAPVNMNPGRDVSYTEAAAAERPWCAPEMMHSDDCLFVLYTSGSTGRPKGLMHSTGGYCTSAAFSFQQVFDHRPDDIFACVADVGWITGHSYVVYGPLLNGGTTVLFESLPTYPDAGRYWEMVQRLQITQFYTAPTAIRVLIKAGDQFVEKYDRSSLRVLGSVGEPINPEAWNWYHDVVGEKRCSIVDTWWQTETGSICMTPLPNTPNPKPGACMQPIYGVDVCLLDEEGDELKGPNQTGSLALRQPTPSMARSIINDHSRFVKAYFSDYPGYYLAGDACHRDEDGHYWIRGRIDDVLNVSGHRIGTSEVESALVGHIAVAEAAAVGFPHEVKGEAIFVYVTLKDDYSESPDLIKELKQQVRTEIGGFAQPDHLVITDNLPKTRSGKIMRRILRNLAVPPVDDEEEIDHGDLSTLAEPHVVHELAYIVKSKVHRRR